MRRFLAVLAAALVTGVLLPASSQAQQSLNIYVGGFTPTGEDARSHDDVLLNNLDFLLFDIKDFNGPTAGAEYLVDLGDFFEAGLGVGLYKRTVPTFDADFVNSNGTEVEADLKLRVVPFTATIRVLPFSRNAPVVPYLGAGVGIFNWRYSESGQFVDTSDNSIFRDSFAGSGTAVGPVVFGGVRIPIGAWDLGGEIRYQKAKGDLPLDQGFSGDKIDLGGWNYLATINIHF